VRHSSSPPQVGLASTNRPSSHSVLAGGDKYHLTGSMIIGRFHHGCPLDDCKRRGFWRDPDIALWDNNRYVGRHHARLFVDKNDLCWVEDLNSLNGTAILRTVRRSARAPSSTHRFEALMPGRGYRLLNGDLVALAYSQVRGPYMMISYCNG
jgi:hypothetical protein